MITIHDRSARDFTASGLAVLDRHLIDPVVSQELNGKFSLTFSWLFIIEGVVGGLNPPVSRSARVM